MPHGVPLPRLNPLSVCLLFTAIVTIVLAYEMYKNEKDAQFIDDYASALRTPLTADERCVLLKRHSGVNPENALVQCGVPFTKSEDGLIHVASYR